MLRLAAVAAGFIVAIASRGGALALGTAAIAAALARGHRRLVALVPVLLIAAVVLPTPLAERVRGGTTRDPFAFERLRIWSSGLRMSADHLLELVNIQDKGQIPSHRHIDKPTQGYVMDMVKGDIPLGGSRFLSNGLHDLRHMRLIDPNQQRGVARNEEITSIADIRDADMLACKGRHYGINMIIVLNSHNQLHNLYP